MADLQDVLIDFDTMEVVLDPLINDAATINGIDVIVQNVGLRIRQQLGGVQFQGFEQYGFDKVNFLKADAEANLALNIANQLRETILEDPNIEDVSIAPGDFDFVNEILPFDIDLIIDGEVIGSLTIPFGSF